jgi:hypothetical protein
MTEHKEVYVLDSTALIDINKHFPRQNRKLRQLAQGGYVKIPEGVFREIKRKTDMLSNTLKSWSKSNPDLIIQISGMQILANKLVSIENKYGEKILVANRPYSGLWKSPSGRKSADGQVIAVAKVLGCTAVSDDRAIRLACMLEGVPCIGWTEFARRTGFINPQLGLFSHL